MEGVYFPAVFQALPVPPNVRTSTTKNPPTREPTNIVIRMGNISSPESISTSHAKTITPMCINMPIRTNSNACRFPWKRPDVVICFVLVFPGRSYFDPGNATYKYGIQ